MNGLMLKNLFLAAVSEAQEDMVHVDLLTIYARLDEAVQLWVRETKGLTSTATIATVVGRQAYDLPADFLRLFVRDGSGMQFNAKFMAKYVYGDNVAWPRLTAFENIFRCNCTDAKEVPYAFAIVDKSTAETTLQGTATAAGALSNGKALLTDALASFAGAVTARDTVINTTRGSSGVVAAVTDAHNVQCALFPEGINSWQLGDGYVIQPQARKQVYLDAPSSVAGHSLIIPYVAVPPPVYAELDSWRLDFATCRAITYEAAFLYQLSSPKAKARQGHHQIFMDALKAERYKLARRRIEGC